MAASFMIPFDKIIEKSFELRDANPDMTIEEIMKEVLPTIHIHLKSDIPMGNIKKKVKTDEEQSSKKKELTEENRCMARTVYENIHLDTAGLLKEMRDDIKNLYGDRCKCRKKEGSYFCTRHSGYQPLGIWNGAYNGKLLEYVNKTKQKDEPIQEKKKVVKEQKDVKEKSKKKKQDVQKEPIFDTKNDDEDSVDAVPITIDETEYYIDSENNLYTEEGDHVGIYNKETNTIISI